MMTIDLNNIDNSKINRLLYKLEYTNILHCSTQIVTRIKVFVLFDEMNPHRQ